MMSDTASSVTSNVLSAPIKWRRRLLEGLLRMQVHVVHLLDQVLRNVDDLLGEKR